MKFMYQNPWTCVHALVICVRKIAHFVMKIQACDRAMRKIDLFVDIYADGRVLVWVQVEFWQRRNSNGRVLVDVKI